MGPILRTGRAVDEVARGILAAAEGLGLFGPVREGRGHKPSIPAEKVATIVHATLHEKPASETHWSCRSMARAEGVGPATAQRAWSARNIQPPKVKTLKLSTDTRFEEKLADVTGLCLNPPEKTIAVSMDESAQIKALNRTHGGLPIKRHGHDHPPREKGRPESSAVVPRRL